MSAFTSQYSHSIDSKGRLIIPAKFRDELDVDSHMTIGLDQCIFIFDGPDWKELVEKLNTIPLTNRDGRKLARYMLANAFPLELDKQGRIVVPNVLREKAGLEKDVVLAGVGSRIEIWDSQAWAKATDYDDMEEIAANMEGLGI